MPLHGSIINTHTAGANQNDCGTISHYPGYTVHIFNQNQSGESFIVNGSSLIGLK